MQYVPFTEEEKLKMSFEKFGGISENDIFLELKKNHYYLLDENGLVIDSSSIYSFQHEDVVYQRIASKINKDLDDKHRLA